MQAKPLRSGTEEPSRAGVCDIGLMGAASVEQRALAAARAVATGRGLSCEQAAVAYAGSNVLVHLRPAPVAARVMTGTVALHDDPQRWLEREVAVLSFLAPSGLAVAPSPLIAPGPYRQDELWMTFGSGCLDPPQPKLAR